ncbi:hypothetical protein MRB53_017647 [Persea americana]|uniref:Uncharacterized protein n=1 Tax=Persea americana TaxID=3435 RepID=A0ACC2M692_PERAE|nr:hypothetical protein MRB53_017647 [Persea americana]
MGLPFFGEMLSFLWYFKIVRCPDDFIMFKRKGLASCGPKAQGIPTHTPDVQCSKGVDNETKVDDSVALSSCTNVGGYVPKHVRDVCKLGPGPLLDEINKDIKGVVAGIRAQPFNIPGTANHHALQEENMAIRERKEGFVTMDGISEMKYTRKANKDVDGQGYRIPKDWQVVVWLRHLHTDPDNFPVPFHFNPDRWNHSIVKFLVDISTKLTSNISKSRCRCADLFPQTINKEALQEAMEKNETN